MLFCRSWEAFKWSLAMYAPFLNSPLDLLYIVELLFCQHYSLTCVKLHQNVWKTSLPNIIILAENPVCELRDARTAATSCCENKFTLCCLLLISVLIVCSIVLLCHATCQFDDECYRVILVLAICNNSELSYLISNMLQLEGILTFLVYWLITISICLSTVFVTGRGLKISIHTPSNRKPAWYCPSIVLVVRVDFLLK